MYILCSTSTNDADLHPLILSQSTQMAKETWRNSEKLTKDEGWIELTNLKNMEIRKKKCNIKSILFLTLILFEYKPNRKHLNLA